MAYNAHKQVHWLSRVQQIQIAYQSKYINIGHQKYSSHAPNISFQNCQTKRQNEKDTVHKNV